MPDQNNFHRLSLYAMFIEVHAALSSKYHLFILIKEDGVVVASKVSKMPRWLIAADCIITFVQSKQEPVAIHLPSDRELLRHEHFRHLLFNLRKFHDTVFFRKTARCRHPVILHVN